MSKELEDLKPEDIAPPMPKDDTPKGLSDEDKKSLKAACLMMAKLPQTNQADMWYWMTLAEKVEKT